MKCCDQCNGKQFKAYPYILTNPNFPKSDTESSFKAIMEWSEKEFGGDKSPIIAPSTTVRYQRWAFQSNLKNFEYFPASPIEHKVLRLGDMPNVLPKKIGSNMIAMDCILI